MIRRTLAGAACTGLLLALTASGASAAQTNVISAIKAQDKAIKADPEYTALANLSFKTTAEAKAAIPKLEKLATVIDGAATTVSRASTTSSTQKTGQADWVAGAREEATGIRDLAGAVNDLVKGEKTAAANAVKKAETVVKAGDTKGLKADKLLGLPKNA